MTTGSIEEIIESIRDLRMGEYFEIPLMDYEPQTSHWFHSTYENNYPYASLWKFHLFYRGYARPNADYRIVADRSIAHPKVHIEGRRLFYGSYSWFSLKTYDSPDALRREVELGRERLAKVIKREAKQKMEQEAGQAKQQTEQSKKLTGWWPR